MYILREFLDQSYPRIGDQSGGKDHTTIMHGVAKISQLLKTNITIEKELQEIKNKLTK